MEGFTVEDQAALPAFVENLERRRNDYASSVSSFDRAQLERFASIPSVLDLVRTRKPWIIPCNRDPIWMCTRGRGPTFRNPNPQNRVLVCVHGRSSFLPFVELGNMPLQSVALLELYGSRGDQVRVYTAQWILRRTRTRRTNVIPLWMGC